MLGKYITGEIGCFQLSGRKIFFYSLLSYTRLGKLEVPLTVLGMPWLLTCWKCNAMIHVGPFGGGGEILKSVHSDEVNQLLLHDCKWEGKDWVERRVEKARERIRRERGESLIRCNGSGNRWNGKGEGFSSLWGENLSIENETNKEEMFFWTSAGVGLKPAIQIVTFI